MLKDSRLHTFCMMPGWIDSSFFDNCCHTFSCALTPSALVTNAAGLRTCQYIFKKARICPAYGATRQESRYWPLLSAPASVPPCTSVRLPTSVVRAKSSFIKYKPHPRSRASSEWQSPGLTRFMITLGLPDFSVCSTSALV